MVSKTRTKPQSHMDETILDNPELEKMLDERQELKESVSAYNKLSKEVKAKLQEITDPSPFRIDRFVIARESTKAREVAFETAPGVRFTIKLAGEE